MPEAIPFSDCPYEQARRKARDPHMTTAGNPLLRTREAAHVERLVDRNMDRLYRDADARTGIHGSVYGAIMDTRYK